MQQVVTISGMTCQGCVRSVTEKLREIPQVIEAAVSLEQEQAVLELTQAIGIDALTTALPNKYKVTLKALVLSDMPERVTSSISQNPNKWRQLRPLFLIFAYLLVAALLLNLNPWNFQAAMLDFMGLFYIVFSFFKLLDLKGFPQSFSRYDPLAKAVPLYGWVYPFIELGLGLLFLMRFQILAALLTTVVILGITTVGVTKTLLNKKTISCACLGTTLQLPMTEATFIENAIMLVMAFTMLLQI
ncbi:MAG: MauE/DoxX family redox-associated membrane protein [Bacteroidota bacterium]